MSKQMIDPEWDNVFRVVDDEPDSITDVLGCVPIFSLLSTNELQQIAQIGRAHV